MFVHITEDDYNEDTDECGEDNTTSSCSASVDDEDIETPNIPLKIQSIFQILCYNIPRGKMKLLFTLWIQAWHRKPKSSELLTSFNRLELCMSYKETKQHRNNLAKLAIISSEQYGISLPIHFSPIQFILVAMNDLDHWNANSLAGISVAHDTATTLIQIKPTSNV